MSIENKIRFFAGSFVISSLIFAKFHNLNWVYFTLFVGANLIQSSFTGFCPLEMFLRKLEQK